MSETEQTQDLQQSNNDGIVSSQDEAQAHIIKIQSIHKKAQELLEDKSLSEKKRFQAVKDTYAEAIKLADNISFADECLVSLFLDYGCLLEKYEQLPEAEENYLKALGIARKLDDNSCSSYNYLIAFVLENIADFHCRLKKYKVAENEYREALSIYYDLAEHKPEQFAGRDADILNKLAYALHKLKKNEEADVEYQEARVIYTELFEKDPKYGRSLARTLRNQAYFHKCVDRVEAAKQEFMAAANIILDLVQKFPCEEYKSDFAKILYNLARFNGNDIKNYDDASKLYISSLKIYQSLAEVNSSSYGVEIANIYFYLGILDNHFGRNSDAQKKFKEAATICKRLKEEGRDRIRTSEIDEIISAHLLLEFINRLYLNEAHAGIRVLKFALIFIFAILLIYSIVYFIRSKTRTKTSVNLNNTAVATSAPADAVGSNDFNKKSKDTDSRIDKSSGTSYTSKEEKKDYFNLGLEKYNKEDYSSAYSAFLKGAENKNADSMYYLGLMYENGLGVDRDYSQSIIWYEKAVGLGHKSAAKKLEHLKKISNKEKEGDSFNSDIAVSKKKDTDLTNGNADEFYNLGIKKLSSGDYYLSYSYFEKAANLKNSDAMNYLGIFYQNGYGVAQNYSKAKDWYEKAAKLNNKDALNNLGLLYQNGYGVKQNLVKAEECYKKAIDLGNAQASKNLEILLKMINDKKNTDSVELFSKGIEKFNNLDYFKATNYFYEAALLNNQDAMCHLGLMYEYGFGVKQDYSKAIEWYKKSDKGKTFLSSLNENSDYLLSLGLEKYENKDYSNALPLFQKSADKNNSKSLFYLGLMYENGFGVARDNNKARDYYEKASKLGYDEAKKKSSLLSKKTNDNKKGKMDNSIDLSNSTSDDLFELGADAYDNGNAELAKPYFEKAASLKNVKAMYALSRMYRYGHGVDKNITTAIKWLEKCAGFGHQIAMADLGDIYYFGEGIKINYPLAKEWYSKAAKLGNPHAQTQLKCMSLRHQ